MKEVKEISYNDILEAGTFSMRDFLSVICTFSGLKVWKFPKEAQCTTITPTYANLFLSFRCGRSVHALVEESELFCTARAWW
jgi:hypothetical protein